MQACFLLDKTCQAPKSQIPAPDKEIRMAQYPVKPDIIRTGLKSAPTSCRGFRFQEANEMKTLQAVIKEASVFSRLCFKVDLSQNESPNLSLKDGRL